ncbi:MAG: transcriptional regulator [Burkholderiales bacterium RIFCSPLOWO2_02_FULL_57_36]|nr:MAG: transcriptional regulator [Burkholderiales bacterium RIFCSPLOWO2_02_FULL_57_36]
MSLKYVVAIIRPDVLDALEARFESLQVPGMTVTKAKGFGKYANFFSKDHLTEHIKVEVFIEESRADTVIGAIRDVAHSDVPGAGIVAVLPVEQFFHLRTHSEVVPGKS